MSSDEKIFFEYRSMNYSDKIEFLRGFDGTLNIKVANCLVDIVKDKAEDDLLRIEAAKILGIYKGEYDDTPVKCELLSIITDPEDDEDLKVYIINSLSLMSVNEADIVMLLGFIRGDYYILLKEVAFSFLIDHKKNPPSHDALHELLNDEVFGLSAKRELQV